MVGIVRHHRRPSPCTTIPAVGTAAALDFDHVNLSTTGSGGFGGEVTALHLNIDFCDVGVLGALGFPFGDLLLVNFSNALAPLNGLTVRDFLGLAETGVPEPSALVLALLRFVALRLASRGKRLAT